MASAYGTGSAHRPCLAGASPQKKLARTAAAARRLYLLCERARGGTAAVGLDGVPVEGVVPRLHARHYIRSQAIKPPKIG